MKITKMIPILFLLFAQLLFAQRMPTPSEMKAIIVVNGNSSTIKEVDVLKVGQLVPKIFRGEHKSGNTPGFDWYISKHYALKTNQTEKEAIRFLELAEAAYPHYIEMTGGEPDGMDSLRMAFVHASDTTTFKQAMKSDVGWSGFQDSGGVTLPASFVAYNYPSGFVDYHFRDLSMHENMHLYNYCVYKHLSMPHRFVEGITTFFSNHVYDSAKKQYTFAVFDKAPTNNPIDVGLRTVAKNGLFKIEELIRYGSDSIGVKYNIDPYEIAGLFTAFCWTDPELFMKWKIWRDELVALNIEREDQELIDADYAITKKLWHGSMESLENEWSEWIKKRRTSYTHIDWGWDQFAGEIECMGPSWDSTKFSQMNLNYTPNEVITDDILRMDFPQEVISPLVDKPIRGVKEPVMSCLIKFWKIGYGWDGFGFGVKDSDRNLLRVVVAGHDTLIVDGTALNFAAKKVNFLLDSTFSKSIKEHKEAGLSVKFALNSLEITLRTKNHEAKFSYPLKADERELLLNRQMALISKGKYHKLTPYLGFKTQEPLKDGEVKPANRWRFAKDKEAYNLYKTAYFLQDLAPKELIELRDTLLFGYTADENQRAKIYQYYDGNIKNVIQAVAKLPKNIRNQALVELSGVLVRSYIPYHVKANKPQYKVVVNTYQPIKGVVEVSVLPKNAFKKSFFKQKFVTDTLFGVDYLPQMGQDSVSNLQFMTTVKYEWQGYDLVFNDTLFFRNGIPVLKVIGPFNNHGDALVDTKQEVEDAPLDFDKEYSGKKWLDLKCDNSNRIYEDFVFNFKEFYGQNDSSSVYGVVWIESKEDRELFLDIGSDDGVKVWLNNQLILTNLTNRSFKRGEDRVKINLKKGRNFLKIKNIHTYEYWYLSLELRELNGSFARNLQYSLKP